MRPCVIVIVILLLVIASANEHAGPLPHDVFLDLLVAARDEFRLPIGGVAHLGGHTGKEASLYDFIGVPKVLYVEAHPAVFAKLEEHIAALRPTLTQLEVRLFHFAATGGDEGAEDGAGTAVFHEASWDMCGSLLPLEMEAGAGAAGAVLSLTESSASPSSPPSTPPLLPPGLVNTGTITVPTRRCDAAFSAADLQGVNVLVMDVQGAEMEALRGCQGFLAQIDIIVSEVAWIWVYYYSNRTEAWIIAVAAATAKRAEKNLFLILPSSPISAPSLSHSRAIRPSS